MHRSAAWIILGVVVLGLGGCDSGPPALPPNPTVDNRDPEVKEADDGMLKQAQRTNAATKKGRP